MPVEFIATMWVSPTSSSPRKIILPNINTDLLNIDFRFIGFQFDSCKGTLMASYGFD